MSYIKSTSDLEAYLVQLETARTAVLLGKAYSMGGRTLTRADERWISSEIEKTEGRLSRRSATNSTTPIFIGSR